MSDHLRFAGRPTTEQAETLRNIVHGAPVLMAALAGARGMALNDCWAREVKHRAPLSCSAKDLAGAKSKTSLSLPQGERGSERSCRSALSPPCGGERNFLGLA